MTYQKALRQTFLSLLLSWRRIPIYACEILGCLRDGARALGVLLLLLLGPALALFAPALALLLLTDDRKQAKGREKLRTEIQQHYGQLRQRTISEQTIKPEPTTYAPKPQPITCRHCGGSGCLGEYEQCAWCDGTGRG